MNNRIIDLIIELKKKCSIKEEDIQQEFDLTHAEYRGVVCIEPGEKVMCTDFSLRMQLSPSRGSRIIEKMIEKGFITETTGNWLKGDIHFGFNISRVFALN